MANSTLWMPVCYDAGKEIDGLWCSHTHYGTAVADKCEAWAEARRMCDECGGIGFAVSRCNPINASDVSRRTSSAEQSSSQGAA
jgi:hypothetical protein